MFSLALLAIAAPIVVVSSQQVHQVVVGSSSGALTFSPDAIVRILYSYTKVFSS